MTSAVERTLDLLARSRDEAAADLLREAAGRVDDEFGLEAVLAIGRHGSMRLKNDLVRRVDELSLGQAEVLRHKARAFSEAAAHGLRSADPGDRGRAVRWIEMVDDFERFEILVGKLVGSGERIADTDEVPPIAAACEHLVDRIYDLTTGRVPLDEESDAVRNATELRQSMSATLTEACARLDSCPVADRLLEWSLVLVDPESAGLQRLLGALDESRRPELLRLLINSRHIGVMDLAWGMMRRTYPLPVAFETWRLRSDFEFICHVLGHPPASPSQVQLQNLSTIDYVPWLIGTPDETAGRLEAIPRTLLPAVVDLIELLGLPERNQKSLLRWLLENGDGPTRERASTLFGLLTREESHSIIQDGLEDEDVDVQTWATGQLRPQDVPNAILLLIQRLDSDCEQIREKARDELSDFDFHRMLRTLATDPEKVTPAMGRLIQKIHPETLDVARAELAHAIRGRRLAAVGCVVQLGLAETLLPALSALLEDSDMLVRRTAADALAAVPTRQAIVALEKCRHDESTRVRSAERSP